MSAGRLGKCVEVPKVCVEVPKVCVNFPGYSLQLTDPVRVPVQRGGVGEGISTPQHDPHDPVPDLRLLLSVLLPGPWIAPQLQD